jgi:hypothetical protein
LAVSTATPVAWAISSSESPAWANITKTPRCSSGRASSAVISLCASSRDSTFSSGVGAVSGTIMAVSSSRAEASTATFCRRKWSQTLLRAMVNSHAAKLALRASNAVALFETASQVSWCRSSAASACAPPSVLRMNRKQGRS